MRGLSDYGPTGERKLGKQGLAPMMHQSPKQARGAANMHSDIRQRLPPGIQMVSPWSASEGSRADTYISK